MAHELIQSVVEIMDSAHNYRYELAEVAGGITFLQDQINGSSDSAHTQIDTHFGRLKSSLVAALDKRLAQLKEEVELIRTEALKPLDECKALVEENLKTAAQVMEEGASILGDSPEGQIEKILKFKDSPKTKALSSVPAIPSPSEVACIHVTLSGELPASLCHGVATEGHVWPAAPVQICEVVEKPGGLLVSWTETEEDSEVAEFCLQYAAGAHRSADSPGAMYHTAYTGGATQFLIKHLNTNQSYSLRVCGRGDAAGGDVEPVWSPWSIPRVASTTIQHYKWSESPENAYCLSNECKVATRTGEGMSHVLYSSGASFKPGNTLTLKVLSDSDKSPGDGICISVKNLDSQFFGQEEIIYVNLYGSVYVDGQEMKMQLPEIKKGSVVAFETEALPNGKIRVSVHHEDRVLTFDWKGGGKSQGQGSMGMLGMMGMGAMEAADSPGLYFGIKFSQEEWKVAVD